MLADQQRLIAALRRPACYPHPVDTVRVIETHISWVLLAGDYAYKIKKALDLGFLNYVTIESRRRYCEAELRLNRRTAPDLYLAVVGVGAGGSIDRLQTGAGTAIEYAVKMRRFEADALMDERLSQGRIGYAHIDALGAVVARFHAQVAALDPRTRYATAPSIRAAAMQNFEQLRALLTSTADLQQVAGLFAATAGEWVSCEAVFGLRRRQGRVRECHGDLHLGNIVLIDDAPVPFDCIEFDPALRWIDVLDEVAFTVMDLLYRGQPGFAWRLLNGYLEATGDYPGVAVLRFYLAYRAAVRAKVAAIRAGQGGVGKRGRARHLGSCRRHMALAQSCLAVRSPALVITHGLPGSGKTTFAQYALQRLGAIRIRSDVERKRLYGLGALEDSRAGAADIYSTDATERTYAHLLALARMILQSGFTVIVDAAFLQRGERERFRALADELAVPFAIAALDAPGETLRQRVDARRNDASEADADVLAKLGSIRQPLAKDELARAASFSTEQAPDAAGNARNWRRLKRLLAPRRAGTHAV